MDGSEQQGANRLAARQFSHGLGERLLPRLPLDRATGEP